MNFVTDAETTWEEEAQEFMDRLSILDAQILNNIVYHKLLLQRANIGLEFVKWFFSGDGKDMEDIESAITRITGVKCKMLKQTCHCTNLKCAKKGKHVKGCFCYEEGK